METNENIIGGGCDMFACRICRTKFGYKHQAWCELSHIISPGCTDCRYWSQNDGACRHPLAKKVGVKE